MKTIVKFLVCALLALFATSPQAISESMNPFAMQIEGIDPDTGTSGDNIFRDVTDLESFENDADASDMIAPAWLEVLTLISPANYPLTTFLTQKTLDGVRGLAKAQSQTGTHKDILLDTSAGDSRFNSKYGVKPDQMRNDKQFSEDGVKNYKLSWGDISVLPFQDSVSAAFTGGSTSGALTVSNVKMWKIGHTLKVQNMEYATSGKPLNLYVAAVNTTAGTVTVYSLGTSGNEVIPAIASGVQVTRMGPASSEGAVKATATSQSPTSDYNYAQKFIVSIAYSNWMAMTQLFTNYSFSMITNLALQDFRYGQEFSFMFGVRNQIILPVESGGSERVNFTGGLVDYIDQSITYGTGGGDTTITETDIVEITKTMRVGNNGSDTRFLYAGSELISALNKGIMSDSTRFVEKESEVIYGLSFTSLYSFFGTINVAYAPLLDQSEYRDRGFLLDMMYIDKFVYQPFRESHVDGVKLRQYDGKFVDITEACGLVVRNKPCHFEILVNPADAA